MEHNKNNREPSLKELVYQRTPSKEEKIRELFEQHPEKAAQLLKQILNHE